MNPCRDSFFIKLIFYPDFDVCPASIGLYGHANLPEPLVRVQRPRDVVMM